MRRRAFITLLGSMVMTRPPIAAAQRAKRLPVVGFVLASGRLENILGTDPVSPNARIFLHGLRELGWVEGHNIEVVRRSTEGDPKNAPAIFAALLANGVDVMMVGSARWLHDAAQAATRTVPTVTVFDDDPVAAGLVSSLGRPNGNLTGVMVTTGPEFHSKQLQLLQELAPGTTRVAFLGPHDVLEQYRTVEGPAGLTVVPFHTEIAKQFDEVFAAALRERVDALMIASGSGQVTHGRRIIAFASTNKLPAMFGFREAVEAGGLMSYGPSRQGLYRQAARLVDRFLNGAKLGDIPIERPTTFELVINAKTAKALGLDIPPQLLARADEVIE